MNNKRSQRMLAFLFRFPTEMKYGDSLLIVNATSRREVSSIPKGNLFMDENGYKRPQPSQARQSQ